MKRSEIDLFYLFYLFFYCALFAGIASVGFAAAYYSPGVQNLFYISLSINFQIFFLKLFFVLCGDIDSIFWKLFYVTGCLFVAMQNMEEWEEAVFDKTKNLIELKSFSLYAFFLTLWRKGHEKGW